MPIALTPDFTWDYVLKEERELPKNKQTIFKLKALTGEEWLAMQNLEGVGYRYAYAMAFGLVGWDNFKDKTGKAINFALDEEKQCGNSNLDLLKPIHLVEIVTAIISRNVVTEDESKNSESADTSLQES